MSTACSLVDPLDGISDGADPPPDSAMDGGEEGGGSAVRDGGPSSRVDGGQPRPCYLEPEPNYPTPWVLDRTIDLCGTIAASDTDAFDIPLLPGWTYALVVTVLGEGELTFNAPAETVAGTKSLERRYTPGEYVRVYVTLQSASAAPQPYHLVLTISP